MTFKLPKLITFGTALFVALAAFCSSAPSAQAGTISKAPNNLGLVGYWSMDDCRGATSTDASGNGNSAALSNFALSTTTSNWTSGNAAKHGCALNFDGINDFTRVVTSSVQSVPFTVCYWAIGQGGGVAWSMLSKNNGNWDGWYGAQGVMGTVVNNSFDGGGPSNNAFNSSVWQHICMLATSNSSRDVYINGVKGTTGVTTVTPASGGYQFVLGGSGRSGSPGTFTVDNLASTGSMDDVRMYNRALSQTDITALYQAGITKIKAANNNGLVASWALDDCRGATATDGSGSGSTGSLQGFAFATSTSNWATGNAAKRGCALVFDGVNDFVNVSSSVITAAPYTFSAWVKLSSSTGGTILSISKNNASNREGSRIYVDAANSFLAQSYSDALTGGGGFSQSTITPEVGRWYFVVGVFASASSRTVYVDGVAYTSNTTTVTTPGVNVMQVGVAKISVALGTNTTFFNGTIDDARIYNRALSATEVSALYGASETKIRALNNAGLVGYWSFDDARGAKATDQSGNGNIGTLTNMTLSTTTSNWNCGNGAKLGCALNFDGTNDYVLVGSPSNLNLTGEMTVTAWMKSSNVTIGNEIAGQANSGASAGGLFNFSVGRTSGRLQVNWGNTNLTAGIVPISNNIWYHVAFTRSGSAGSWTGTYYVNGALDSSFVTATNPTSNSTTQQNTNIGNNGATSGLPQEQFNGPLDEVRIYNRALPASEIQNIYKAGMAR